MESIKESEKNNLVLVIMLCGFQRAYVTPREVYLEMVWIVPNIICVAK
jgi:hypothetical protein